jgi:hypothetical protein
MIKMTDAHGAAKFHLNKIKEVQRATGSFGSWIELEEDLGVWLELCLLVDEGLSELLCWVWLGLAWLVLV